MQTVWAAAAKDPPASAESESTALACGCVRVARAVADLRQAALAGRAISRGPQQDAAGGCRDRKTHHQAESCRQFRQRSRFARARSLSRRLFVAVETPLQLPQGLHPE